MKPFGKNGKIKACIVKTYTKKCLNCKIAIAGNSTFLFKRTHYFFEYFKNPFETMGKVNIAY